MNSQKYKLRKVIPATFLHFSLHEVRVFLWIIYHVYIWCFDTQTHTYTHTHTSFMHIKCCTFTLIMRKYAKCAFSNSRHFLILRSMKLTAMLTQCRNFKHIFTIWFQKVLSQMKSQKHNETSFTVIYRCNLTLSIFWIILNITYYKDHV